MALEAEKTIQREPVMARGVEADEKDDRVKGINHGAQAQLRRF
jgi:hypothetical protein